jgi:valyl-tRNA synthetase
MNRPATDTRPATESKGYNPAAVEKEVAQIWVDEKCFHAEPTDRGQPYSIVIPPPNVTAALHLGHALNNTLQDILIRRHRMAGENTVWLPGTDHAGIATQTVVEKRVLKEEGKKRTDFPREQFVAKIQAWKDEYEQTITGQLKAMGCSCDWDRQAFTMDEPRAKAVREAFFQLFKDGLIYRGKRLVNWDPVTQTALADDEVENEEIDGFFYYLKYPLEDGTGHVTVATTRPETMLGDTAVAINPKDPRAAALRGKNLRLPIVGRIIPIIEDDYVVMPDPNGDDPKAKFATGFLKVTPAHDPNDYEIGQRHKLAVINVMAPDASISDKHGWTDIGNAQFVLGQSRERARKSIVNWFKDNGLLEEVKPYRHSVGHSYRSHVPIEPYLSDQWYCRVTDSRLAGAALNAIHPDQVSRNTGVPPVLGTPADLELPITEPAPHGRDARVTDGSFLHFHPPRYAKTFQTWHENIRDWCISRQLWWGHRIPVWSKRRHTSELFEGVRGAGNELPREEVLRRSERDGFKIRTNSGETISGATWRVIEGDEFTEFICIDRISAEVEGHLERQGYSQDPDVLDTWFSSGLWPLSTLGWPEQTAELEKWNPTSVLCTAREIITLWVSRMVMFNLYFKNRLPFKDVFIHAMIQDGEGRKMSKSLGNGVDPLDIIHSHGTDAMRFTLAAMATNTQDVRLPVKKDPTTGRNTSEKFDEGRKFCNKIWQVTEGFALPNLKKTSCVPVHSQEWSLADRWIVSRFSQTLRECDEALSIYRFDQYAKLAYDFFWNDFCAWYIEIAKLALRDPTRAGQTANVLAAVLDGSLRMLHPVIPFITEALWWKLNEARPERELPGHIEAATKSRLVISRWPTVGPTDDSAERLFPLLRDVIVAIRNLRNEHKVDVKKVSPVSIAANADATTWLTENQKVIESLATCQVATIAPQIAPPANSGRALVSGVEIFVEGLVDEDAEKQRKTKRIDELTRQIPAMEGRLNNPGYLAKAPPALIEQTKQQLTAMKEELTKLTT